MHITIEHNELLLALIWKVWSTTGSKVNSCEKEPDSEWNALPEVENISRQEKHCKGITARKTGNTYIRDELKLTRSMAWNYE
jgi:hypothetical protein